MANIFKRYLHIGENNYIIKNFEQTFRHFLYLLVFSFSRKMITLAFEVQESIVMFYKWAAFVIKY